MSTTSPSSIACVLEVLLLGFLLSFLHRVWKARCAGHIWSFRRTRIAGAVFMAAATELANITLWLATVGYSLAYQCSWRNAFPRNAGGVQWTLWCVSSGCTAACESAAGQAFSPTHAIRNVLLFWMLVAAHAPSPFTSSFFVRKHDLKRKRFYSGANLWGAGPAAPTNLPSFSPCVMYR